MNNPSFPCEYYYESVSYYGGVGDKPLVKRIFWERLSLGLLLLLDAFSLLFVDGDMLELKKMGLPAWWWVLSIVAHIGLTFWLNFYFATAKKYLCLHKPTAKIQAMSSAERQKEYRYRNQTVGLAGGASAILLVFASLLPHILTMDKSFVRFEVGLIVFKTSLLVAGMQTALFLCGALDIRQSIAEWRGLLADGSSLSFPTYAEFYDGHDDSIAF